MNNMKKDEDFFRLWSLKESLMKCLGVGLKGDYKKIIAREGTYLYEGHEVSSISSSSLDGYALAITIDGKESLCVRIEFDKIA